ncbi:MAG: hypothetical protein V3V99_01685 [candidate division Zixibacteria bacterium]
MIRIGCFLFLGLFYASIIFAADPTAYVVNTSGETLSKIDLNTGQVTNNIIAIGTDIYSFPNQIIIRDTLAYVVLSGTSEIQIINLNNETTVGWIELPEYSNPFWMAFFDDQYLYVTLMVNNSVAKVDVTTGEIVITVEVGQSPEGIIIYNDRAYIAVTGYDFDTYTWGQGRVVVYDCLADTVMNDYEILTGTNPQFLAVDMQGIIHCICTGDYWMNRGAVYRIDPASNSIIDSKELGGDPSLLAVGADNIAYISAGGWTDDGEVYSYNCETFEIYHDANNPIYVDSGSMGIVAFQDTTSFACTFGDRIFRINSEGQIINTYNVGDGPVHIDFNYQPGDANGDWGVDVGDAVYLINHVFKNGPAPSWPGWRANVNMDKYVNIGDAVYLVNFIFRDGPAPRIGSGITY